MKNLERIIKKGKIEHENSEKNIYAHYKNQNKKETYNKHQEKVDILFREFLDRYEDVFEHLFRDIKRKFNLNISQKNFENYLSEIVKFHDVGKANPKFQNKVLENPEFDELKFNAFRTEDISTDHSYPSAVLTASILFEKYPIPENSLLLLFPYTIWGHHTRLKNSYDHYLADVGGENKKYTKTILYLSDLLGRPSKEAFRDLKKVQRSFKEKLEEISWRKSSLSIIYNLIYSILISADSIASNQNYVYKSVKSVENDLKDILNDRINKCILERMKRGFEKKQSKYREAPDKKTNRLRQEMFEESHENLDDGLEKNKRVFYLKMPTGGGKTNTSMGLALEILERTTTDRLIYALPYTNIIDQNYSYLKDIFALKEPYEIRKIYSGTKTIFENDEEADKSQILLDDDFYNYPVICTTNVSFFRSIIKFKRKEKNRFHSLTNSVVILDEVQSLPAEHWPTLNYLINEMAEKLNMYFILMSATVPKLNKLIVRRNKAPPYENNIHHLIEKPYRYFKKFERNKIMTETPTEFNMDHETSKSKLKKFLKSTIEENLKKYDSGLIVVNTVQTSREIYEMAKEIRNKNSDFSLALLNSTFLPHQKKKIITKLDEMEESDEKFILVSTQSIEAGMDVDFGFVVRDFATLDSIEQVRGRCNREKDRNTGNVYLLKLIRDSFEESDIYDSNKLRISKKILSKTDYNYDYEDIESYYEKLTEKINVETEKPNRITEENNIVYFNKTKYENEDYWKNKGMDVFHVDIIENRFKNYSFFVKTGICLDYFSNDELNYMRNLSKEGISFEKNKKIQGSKVLDYYLSKKEKLMKNGEYIEKKIFRKEFGSILQKFIFHIIGRVDEGEIKMEFGEKKEYFYVIEEDKIGEGEEHYYSLRKGFDKRKLQEKNNFIL